MELHGLLSYTFFLLFFFVIAGFRPTKRFVFGDSYSDTGNNPKSLASSWKAPYGVTFPRKPVERYSDGRVLTDYKTECRNAWKAP
ncbi:hypothetical protein L1987_58295 [Smallanthus sonchifolius]|uniref:Uncharacterized protein n=1 Tax=Smallanthus sonchifolius TaxID=185202 RepID=A0ACB9DEW8_9ASTR|nr:hypothetical protein L1987_58295 [Smallanthus sonchifolius]